MDNFTFKIREETKKGLYLYLAVAVSALLVPKGFVYFHQVWFTLTVAFFVFLWFKVLRFLYFRINMEDDSYRWDMLVYDSIYILGLPIIINIMVIGIGRPLFVNFYMAVIYYLAVVVVMLVKLIMMRTQYYYMVRFVLTVLFILMNVVIVQQVFNIWYGLNQLGQGF